MPSPRETHLNMIAAQCSQTARTINLTLASGVDPAGVTFALSNLQSVEREINELMNLIKMAKRLDAISPSAGSQSQEAVKSHSSAEEKFFIGGESVSTR